MTEDQRDISTQPVLQAGYNRLKRCRYGYMLYNVNDRYIGKSFDFYGEYSEGEVEVFRRQFVPGDIVVEVGANIGAHTVWLAQATSPGGGVFAFEPQRMVYQTLCANLAINSLSNVAAHLTALGDKEGVVTVPVLDPTKSNNFGALFIQGHTVGEPVALMRLDQFKLPQCRFIKVDVEGMEAAVLRGGRELIARTKPILYVENDREEHSAELIQLIASFGYDMYWHRPFLFHPNNFFKQAEDIFPKVASWNMLCLPRGTAPLAGLERVTV